VQTASEVLAAHEFGYRTLKYYPSAASNGHVVLADYANIFADVVFIPTGKIEKSQVPLYAALGNVLAVGGSFMIAPNAANTTALAASFLRR
jgi:2-dehydro-3-deoxyphosphogluconate aldolase/(4S)-4-hydroxy-2-oxoglutarate aldolase